MSPPRRVPGRPTRQRFFCELEAPRLGEVFTTEVVAQLRRLGAGVTMALLDLSTERAAVVRRLIDAGVPVGGWLLVTKAQGYFATVENAGAFECRARDVVAWSRKQKLGFEALGLDFEPDLNELGALYGKPLEMLSAWGRRAKDRRAHDTAVTRYARLKLLIESQGFGVETYHLPTLVEDRRKGRSGLQRLTGALDVKAEREVVMLYSSLLGPTGAGFVAHWAPHCAAVGVGSTGGGVDPLPKLSWTELERDLLLAAAHVDDVSVFSLEGCVQQDYLARLNDFDWRRPAPALKAQRLAARALAAVLRTAGRLSAEPSKAAARSQKAKEST